MKIVYYFDSPPETYTKSIFLAGPSPRKSKIQSWRPEALKILEAKGYDGVVFVPEQKPGNIQSDYDWSLAPEWEHTMLNMADIILFWVPRDLTVLPDGELKLPGFTTNVEFGYFVSSGKAVLGYPEGAPHTDYLRFMADKYYVPMLSSLEETIDKSLELLGVGALRTDGERSIPLFLWNTKTFQEWHCSQKRAGNSLNGARLRWMCKVGQNKDKVFYWVLHPSIHVLAENRNKTNELVISRFDISSAVLYRRRTDVMKSEVVLVREFRSPARNGSGFIWELPGGSSADDKNPLETIVEEIKEETGLFFSEARFERIQSRQMAATMSAHQGTLYAVELVEKELNWLKNQKGLPHGSSLDDPTGERVFIEVVTLKEILEKNLVDWSNLGMILSVLFGKGS